LPLHPDTSDENAGDEKDANFPTMHVSKEDELPQMEEKLHL